jgi:hypothetical protein
MAELIEALTGVAHVLLFHGAPTVGHEHERITKVDTLPLRPAFALAARDRLRCIPCWRNENTPCALTGRRDSACLSNIGVAEVVETVRDLLRAGRAPLVDREETQPVRALRAHPRVRALGCGTPWRG